jgi:hypothetical protein
MPTAPRGRYELVRPFAMVRMSGTMSPCSKANILPVRPKPHITSSQMKRMPWLVEQGGAGPRAASPSGGGRMPLVPMTVSMIIAAIVCGPS